MQHERKIGLEDGSIETGPKPLIKLHFSFIEDDISIGGPVFFQLQQLCVTPLDTCFFNEALKKADREFKQHAKAMTENGGDNKKTSPGNTDKEKITEEKKNDGETSEEKTDEEKTYKLNLENYELLQVCFVKARAVLPNLRLSSKDVKEVRYAMQKTLYECLLTKIKADKQETQQAYWLKAVKQHLRHTYDHLPKRHHIPENMHQLPMLEMVEILMMIPLIAIGGRLLINNFRYLFSEDFTEDSWGMKGFHSNLAVLTVLFFLFSLKRCYSATRVVYNARPRVLHRDIFAHPLTQDDANTAEADSKQTEQVTTADTNQDSPTI